MVKCQYAIYKIGLLKTIFFQIKFDNVSITGMHWQIWKINKNPSCSSSYFGDTCRHFKTNMGYRSHIFKHLHSTATCFDSLLLFFVSLLSIIFIISDTNYRHLLLSQLHFATTSSHYYTSCITPLSFIYYFHYLYYNYEHLLLS